MGRSQQPCHMGSLRPRHPHFSWKHREGHWPDARGANAELPPSYPASQGRHLEPASPPVQPPPPARALAGHRTPDTGAVRQSHAVSGEERGLQNQTDPGSNPGSACHSCVTSDKSCHCSGPQFLLCKLRLIRPASYGATRCFRLGRYTPVSLVQVWLLLIFIKG